jgi:hypothetical protein
MAKGKEQSSTPVQNPERLTKEIEAFLSEKQISIAGSIDQLLKHKKEIDRKADEDKRTIDQQVDKLNELYHKATNRYYLSSPKPTPVNGKAEGRQRRSREELEADALAIVQFVEAKGNDGATGAQIREQWPNVGPAIVKFVEKYGGGKIRTEGHKASTRYFAG